MSTQRFSSWRFRLGEGDEAAKDAGLRISNLGRIELVKGPASIRQAILMLLATRPGERLMRPNYGCHLGRLVFSPNDDTTAGLAIHYVRQAIERWEPRVDVMHVDASRAKSNRLGMSQASSIQSKNDASGFLEIFLEYKVKATLSVERLAYAFDLMGERT
jgi:phage baseplate assembly protein W